LQFFHGRNIKGLKFNGAKKKDNGLLANYAGHSEDVVHTLLSESIQESLVVIAGACQVATDPNGPEAVALDVAQYVKEVKQLLLAKRSLLDLLNDVGHLLMDGSHRPAFGNFSKVAGEGPALLSHWVAVGFPGPMDPDVVSLYLYNLAGAAAAGAF
jgi:hypothetical protein